MTTMTENAPTRYPAPAGFVPWRALRLPIFLAIILAVILTRCGEDARDKDVVSYVSDLRREDFLQRIAAAKELAAVAEEIDVVAVPYLIESLRAPREALQRYSAQALGRIRCYSAISALIEGARNESDYVRYDCVMALGRLDDPRVHQPLLDALADTSSYVRWAAAEALGELKVSAAYPRLIAGLKDSSSFIRSASANALGRLDNPGAIPHLKSSVYDRNLWVRNASARALARLGNNEGMPVLIKNLESEAQEKDKLVRAQAADFLREVTGENFGFDPLGPLEGRREAIRRWERWWQSRR